MKLVFDGDSFVCESSLPIVTNKNACAQACVHNTVIQEVIKAMREEQPLSDSDLRKALTPMGYKDWAPR